MQPSPESLWASRLQVSLSVSSRTPDWGSSGGARGEEDGEGTCFCRAPSPPLQRVPRWRGWAALPSSPSLFPNKKAVCGKGGAWPDRGPGISRHSRARGRPCSLAFAEESASALPLPLGKRPWRAGSRPSSCREMRCARCRCCTASTSPSRSGTTWPSGLRASHGRHVPPCSSSEGPYHPGPLASNSTCGGLV